MRSGFGLRDVLLGSGLIVALTTMLVVAAVLAGAGLYLELSETSIVVTQRPTTLVASQSAAASSDEIGAADEHGASASPEDRHQDRTGGQQPPVALQADRATPAAEEKPGQTASPEAVGGGDGTPGAPPDAASAAVIAEASQPAARVTRVKPTPGPRGAPRPTADLPIVMYHHVGPLPPDPDIFRRDLTVSPELFEQTLQGLAEREVQTVTMHDLMEHFEGGPALPKRSVVLTFDDGYDDNYEHAFRLLRKHDMVGTFFITTDFVEQPGYLTWEQITEMAEAGMEIAAHSSNHADFTKIGPNELKRQLEGPKTMLEQHLGRPIRYLAYPAGKHDPAVIAASRAAGYAAAVTVLHGTRHSPGGAFELRRVRARGADTPPEIIARMTPASWHE